MIYFIGELKCRRHPKYRAIRKPKLCLECWDVYTVISGIRELSKRYKIEWRKE